MSKSKFAEAEAALANAVAATRCGVCNWLTDPGPDTDPADVEFMRALMAQPVTVKGHAHVSRVFGAGGVKISADTIARHRADHQARQ